MHSSIWSAHKEDYTESTIHIETHNVLNASVPQNDMNGKREQMNQ